MIKNIQLVPFKSKLSGEAALAAGKKLLEQFNLHLEVASKRRLTSDDIPVPLTLIFAILALLCLAGAYLLHSLWKSRAPKEDPITPDIEQGCSELPGNPVSNSYC